MNSKLIPAIGSDEAKVNFDKEKWRNFSQRIQRNSFVKLYLFQQHQGICPWCGEKLRKGVNLQRFQVHHVDYMHQCIHSTFIELPSPTENRPNRVVKIPDCERCFKNNRVDFDICINKIVPVHKLCNAEIEKRRQEN